MKKFLLLLIAALMSIAAFAGNCKYCHQDESHHAPNCPRPIYNDSDSSEENWRRFHRYSSESSDESSGGRPAKRRRTLNECLADQQEPAHSNTALCTAASKWDLESVKYLIRNGADVNFISSEGSALRCAIKAHVDGHDEGAEVEAADVIQFLLDQGADVMDAVFEGNAISTLFTVISYLNHISYEESAERYEDLIDRIISKIDVTSKNEQGKTALAVLVQTPLESNQFQVLLDKGADINAVDESGVSVLTHAIQSLGATPDVSEYLVNQGASVSMQEIQATLKTLRLQDPNEPADIKEWQNFLGKLLATNTSARLRLLPFSLLFNPVNLPTELLRSIAFLDMDLTAKQAEENLAEQEKESVEVSNADIEAFFSSGIVPQNLLHY